jgi:HK97 family phage major capsid protein
MNDFEQKILTGVEAIDQKVKSFEQFQVSTKQAIGELGELKKHANSQAEINGKVQRAIEALRVEQMLGHKASAIQRLVAQPGVADYVIGCCRRAANQELTPAQKTALTNVDSSLGQAVSPTEVGAAIYDNLLRYGQWSTLNVRPLGSKTITLPYMTARPTAYIVADGAQITEGAVTGSSTSVSVKNFAAWIPVGMGVLEDSESAPDLAAYILDLIAQAIAYRLDWACFAADGTDDTTDGAYSGIASSGTAAVAANGNTIVKELELEDFVRCLTTVNPAVLQRQAKWWIHPTIIAKMIQIRDSNGRPIFLTANEAPSMGGIGSILGYPVIATGAMPSTDSAGNVVAAFGDPMGHVVGVRKAMNLASSEHFQFDYARVAFRGIMRACSQTQLATSFAKLTLAAQ